jgi:hypothetical protein
MDLDLVGVWRDVAARMAAHYEAGRGHLVTEDVLRWATIDALGVAGVGPNLLVVEQIIPITRGKLDLVVRDDPPIAIEFKFPRDSRSGISPDTMTLGELLKDVHRLAALDEFGERWAVMLLNDRLCRYLARRSDCRFLFEPGDRVVFDPDAFALLPQTASRMLSDWREATTSAECVASAAFHGHRLVAYRVDPTVR